ncbi:MAG: DUF29 family protein [Hyphomicrobiales bacterium]
MITPAAAKRTQSWAISITAQRNQAARILRHDAGLASRIEEARLDAYEDARLEAASETGLKPSVFPVAVPYTLDETMTRDFPLD